MIAHILCPGPSLASYRPNSVINPLAPPMLTIGVNRAVFAHRCDWWAVMDYPVIQKYGLDVNYPIKVFTMATNAFVIPKRIPACIEAQVQDNLLGMFPRESGWTMFSMNNAIVLAAFLGAKDIRVYGCDWSGVNDWDGHGYERLKGNEARVTRTAESYELQRKHYESTREMLAGHGVTVERCNGFS